MHPLIKKLKELGLKAINHPQKYNPLQEFACRVSTKEIVHSIILADLMRPDGKHYLGRHFIDSLLKKADLDSNSISDVKVATEYRLLGDRWDKRRMDILITNNIAKDSEKEYALIIENKLNDASYLQRQLEDYRDAIKINCPEDKVKILCFHRLKKAEDSVLENSANVKIIYAQEIADLILDAIKNSQTSESCFIKAYSRYLKNLAIENGDIDNADILASDNVSVDDFNELVLLIQDCTSNITNFSEEEVLFLNSMNIAYQDIHKAFVRRIIVETLSSKIKGANKSEPEAGYPFYASVWDETEYRNTEQWLSVGFSESHVHFYLVSHNQEENRRNLLATKAGFGNPKFYKRQGYYWYSPIDPTLQNIEFQGKPDFNEVRCRIECLLSKINKQ
ncbi:MAG: PD-(D/E)XK nuclease family protein [Muribaculaceae bacterium]|nr:PD-(D/E)XK nuclease family protein [Muribaculaceae bacterium]